MGIGIKNPEAVADVYVRKHGDGMGRQGSPRWCGKRFAWLRSPGPPKVIDQLAAPMDPYGPVKFTIKKSCILEIWDWIWYPDLEMLRYSEVFRRYCCKSLQVFMIYIETICYSRVAVCFSSAPFANVEQDFVAHPGTTNWPLSGLWFFPFLWDATKIENLTFLILRVKVFGRSCNETAPCLSEASLEQIVNVYNT